MKDLINYITEAFRDAKNGDEFYTRIEDIEKGLYYIYDKDEIWSDIIKDKKIINVCQEIYDTAKTIIE